METQLQGIIHGRIIELERDLGLPDGQSVRVTIQPMASGHSSPESAGGRPAYTPYQPALDAGISEEWDRKNARRIELAKRKARNQLTTEEEAEFQALQTGFFAHLEKKIPPRPGRP